MKDLRNKTNDKIIFKGKTITSSNNSNEKISTILDFIGMPKDTNLIQKIAGHLSMNCMEVNINNVESFIKENNIPKKADLRKSASSVVNVNKEIDDYDVFVKSMEQKGYNQVTNNFLVKNILVNEEELEVNISINNSQVKTITVYKNSKLVDNIPETVVEQVNSDINNSLI